MRVWPCPTCGAPPVQDCLLPEATLYIEPRYYVGHLYHVPNRRQDVTHHEFVYGATPEEALKLWNEKARLNQKRAR